MPHGCTADLRLKSADPNGSPNQRSATTPHDHSDDCGQRSCLHHSAHFAASLKRGATSPGSRLVQASCHDRDAIKRNTIHERDTVQEPSDRRDCTCPTAEITCFANTGIKRVRAEL
jgi:hypothetical protein